MLSLVFDVDDTLYERHTPFVEACKKTFGSKFDFDSRLLFKQFIKRGNEVFEESMNGTISMEEMWIYRISRAMEDIQMEITPQKALEFQKTYDWYQHHIEMSDTITEILDWCKENGIVLGIITNGPSEHQRMKCHALGLGRWIEEENILATGDIGISKPDIAVFKAAERKMQLDLKDTWYVGDSYEHDIVGAKTAGWNTIWLDKEEKADSMPDCVADYIVPTEEALQKCIQYLKNQVK